VELRQLRCFASVFEEGTITGAARRLNVVQPALSVQLAKLEAEVGQKLFERGRLGLEPTPAGRRMYSLFMPILRDVAQARAQMAHLSKEISGRVAIGLVTSVTNSVLSNCILECARRHPNIQLMASDGYSSAMIDAVMSRHLDIALINRPRTKIGLPAEVALEERMVLMRAPGTDTRRKAVRIGDLGDLRLVLPSKRHGLRGIMDYHFAEQGIDIEPHVEVDSLNVILDLVKATNWVTILPRIAAHHELTAGTLVADAIAGPGITRQLLWIHHPRRTPSAADRCFMDIMNEQLQLASEVPQAARMILKGKRSIHSKKPS
jgi:LysR family transcriptional regulator, nitrogen assimilation regulatory protein